MSTLGMIVSDEVGDGSAQRVLADEDESVQALGFDRLHNPLGERIRLRRQLHLMRTIGHDGSPSPTLSILAPIAVTSWSAISRVGVRLESTTSTRKDA